MPLRCQLKEVREILFKGTGILFPDYVLEKHPCGGITQVSGPGQLASDDRCIERIFPPFRSVGSIAGNIIESFDPWKRIIPVVRLLLSLPIGNRTVIHTGTTGNYKQYQQED